MNINENIKELRIANAMTMEELGQRIGVSKQTIQRYETGAISTIPYDKILSLAKVFSVSPSELMGWQEIEYEINRTKDTKQNDRIFTYYEQLTSLDKRKVTEFAKILAETSELEKKRETLLRAAHEIVGSADEDKQHDYDIMKDENF